VEQCSLRYVLCDQAKELTGSHFWHSQNRLSFQSFGVRLSFTNLQRLGI
jgi:hypothetical protein